MLRRFAPALLAVLALGARGTARAADAATAARARRLAPIGAAPSYELVMARWGDRTDAPYVTGAEAPSIPELLALAGRSAPSVVADTLHLVYFGTGESCRTFCAHHGAFEPLHAMVLSSLPPSHPSGSGLAPGPLAGPLPGDAGSPRLGRSLRVELREDNDAFGVSRPITDEFYTQGFRFLVRWGLDGAGPDDQVGIAIGQNIYTPSNLRTTDLNVLRVDRPYAGWLYASALFRAAPQSNASLRFGFDAAAGAATETEAELTAGVTGQFSGAADMQRQAHVFLDQQAGMGNPIPPDPAGWSVYQLETMPTIDLSFRHQRDVVQASARVRDLTSATGAALGLRIAPRVRFDVGSTYDAASLGLEARAGLVGASGPAWRPRDPFRLYAYGRADARYVLWNAFIEGPLRNGVVALVRLERLQEQLEAGVVLRLGHVEVSAAQLWTTPELSPAPPGTPHLHDVGRFTAAWVTP